MKDAYKPINAIKEIFNYRELLISLISKTLNARYKGSFLGFLWTFINPIMQLIIYTLVFKYIFKVPEDNYAMFLFVALLPWTSFLSAVNGSLDSIIGSSSLVKKIYFPRLILPLSISLTFIIDYLYCIPILFIVMLAAKMKITLWLLLFPVILLIQFIYQTGLCFIFSSINVKFRDVRQIVIVATMAWLYLTPVLYKIEMIPDKYSFFGHIVNPRLWLGILNPMTGIINSYRDVFYYGSSPDFLFLGISCAAAVITLFIGYITFNYFERTFAEDL